MNEEQFRLIQNENRQSNPNNPPIFLVKYSKIKNKTPPLDSHRSGFTSQPCFQSAMASQEHSYLWVSFLSLENRQKNHSVEKSKWDNRCWRSCRYSGKSNVYYYFFFNETEWNTYYDLVPYSMDSKPLFPFPHLPSQKIYDYDCNDMILWLWIIKLWLWCY